VTLSIIMRVNLTAHTSSFGTNTGMSEPIVLTVRPTCRIPGDFRYMTDGKSLLKLLRQGTELRSSVIENFEKDLQLTRAAKLLGVEMSDRVLTEIGYFVD
jgi:hypothetical protein